MRKCVVIITCLLALSAWGQDYINYHKTWVHVDDDVSKGHADIALARMDSIYNAYTFVYAKHSIKALQISCYMHDFNRAANWLSKCFTQGVPLWLIRNDKLTKEVFMHTETFSIIQRYDSLRSVYHSSINTSIRKTIDSLYAIDQLRTNKVNDGFVLFKPLYGLRWLRNNKAQFNLIRSLTKQYGFPGERLIGLPDYFEDSVSSYKSIMLYGPAVYDQRAFIMLVHYYSTPREDINDLLLQSVRHGYLPPNQFASINDFRAKWGKKKYGASAYYNVWHRDTDSSHLVDIDRRREQIGLNSYATQQETEMRSKKRRMGNTSQEFIRE